jgi:hypothetical protein
MMLFFVANKNIINKALIKEYKRSAWARGGPYISATKNKKRKIQEAPQGGDSAPPTIAYHTCSGIYRQQQRKKMEEEKKEGGKKRGTSESTSGGRRIKL